MVTGMEATEAIGFETGPAECVHLEHHIDSVLEAKSGQDEQRLSAFTLRITLTSMSREGQRSRSQQRAGRYKSSHGTHEQNSERST